VYGALQVDNAGCNIGPKGAILQVAETFTDEHNVCADTHIGRGEFAQMVAPLQIVNFQFVHIIGGLITRTKI
jgi:hypothetical protein